jgi:hypothetical protein
MTLQIDMRDPAVKRLLGQDNERELVQLAGDAPDPTGTGPNGAQTTYHLNRSAICHPLVTYRHGTEEFLLELDVYAHPGEPMVVHLICPRCHHALTIPATRKAIEIRLDVGPKAQGDISIETFECTWELAHVGKHIPGLVGGGMSLCRWKVAIDHNVAKDA